MSLVSKTAPSSPRVLGHKGATFLQAPHRPTYWRLEVRADSNDRGMFLSDSFAASSRPHSTRLVNYISAGGMRTLQPGRFADRDARNRQRFVRLALGLFIIWLIFLLIPCT
jgi:hypothetical protein